MQLSLLISDNSLEDSTQTALKKIRKGRFVCLSRINTQQAVDILEDILQNHKGEKIEDEALVKTRETLGKTEASMKMLQDSTISKNCGILCLWYFS